jgi:cysteine desulfurase
MIYLDNAATTKVDERVVNVINKFFNEKYGNASSIHKRGVEANSELQKAREIIAKSINAKSHEIIFTSGGSEANNMAIKGVFFANKCKGHIISAKTEHDSVLACCEWVKEQGGEMTYLDVDKEGFVDIKKLREEIRKNTILVSIMHANNEVGTIQNLKEIGKMCREKGVLFHTDACQSYTKVDIDVRKDSLDLVSLNAHKIHGPKGIGALFVREGVRLEPLIHGGGQEKGLRSGTENIAFIAGFAEAVKISKKEDIEKMKRLRDRLIKGLVEVKGARLNGAVGNNRLCNNVNFSFKGIEGEAIVLYLDAEGICCSTGSACSSKSLKPSHVLLALGLKPEEAHSSVRLSLSRENNEKEIDEAVNKVKKVVEKLKEISPYGK